MGDISPGMKVLGSDGSTVEAIASPGEHKADSYRVRLERGGACEEIIASGDHVWPVLDLQSQADVQLRSDRAGVPVETGLWMHKAKMLSTRQIAAMRRGSAGVPRSEEHTTELQSRENLVCRLLLAKKNKKKSKWL